MKMKGIVIFSAIMMLALSCTKGISKPSYKFKKSLGNGIAAQVGDIKVSDAELTGEIQAEIYEAEYKLFELKKNALKKQLLDKLVASDPKSKGMSTGEFLEKVISKKAKVAKSDYDKFIKDRKIPLDQITPQVKERINHYLEAEAKKKVVDTWMGEKLSGKEVEVFFQAPRRPTYDVKVTDAPTFGSKDAKVTIVEFSDFQCPYCAKGADVLKELKKKYGNKIQIGFKQFPLPFHSQAKKASVAALCANEQSSSYFWKLHDKMFADQSKLSVKDIKASAKSIGVNVAKFDKCFDDQKYLAQVERDITQGKNVGVKSTPTFFVNGQLVNGAQAVEVFAEIIDAELEK